MQIGEPLRTIVVEPLELPVIESQSEPSSLKIITSGSGTL
jgi:hypothetical protein